MWWYTQIPKQYPEWTVLFHEKYALLMILKKDVLTKYKLVFITVFSTQFLCIKRIKFFVTNESTCSKNQFLYMWNARLDRWCLMLSSVLKYCYNKKSHETWGLVPTNAAFLALWIHLSTHVRSTFTLKYEGFSIPVSSGMTRQGSFSFKLSEFQRRYTKCLISGGYLVMVLIDTNESEIYCLSTRAPFPSTEDHSLWAVNLA